LACASLQVEGREPPRAAAPSPSPQAGGRPQPFQQQQQHQQQQQYQQQQHAAAPSPPGTRIIPIQIEGAAPPAAPTPAPPHHQPQSPQNMQQRRPVYVHNKFSPPSPACTPSPAHDSAPAQSPRQLQQQHSWGTGAGPASPAPIQSRSFRVLQKITDTDQSEDEQTSQQNQWSQQTPQQSQWNPQSTQGVPVHELRKLQLSEDDRALMNKFKAQVDEDSFLHNESDPRYRGASIPSRAFRMLQSMTDGAGGDYADQHQVPRSGGPVRSGPPTMSAHQPATESAPQPYIPPSEQQVPEPRKYVGGSIPSRSFRMLQAMTGSPESCVTPAESSSSVSAPEEESSAQSSSDEESSGSDTEVEEEQDSKPLDKKGNGSGSGSALQMIRSVSDINVYKNNSKSEVGDSETNDEETEQEESEEEEEEEEEEDEEVEEENENEEREEHLPHQLSVIFEESEQSDVESVKHAKSLGNSSESVNPSEDGDSSTATLDDGDDDDDDESDVDFDSVDPASSTVTVRLPLKLKFSRSANNEEVTTVIVGNSQVKRTEAELESFTKEVTTKEKEETVVAGGKDNAVKDSAAKESTTKGSAAKDSACGKVDVGGRRDSDTPNVSVTISFPSKSSPASSPTETPGSRFSDNNVCRQMSTESLDVYETCESDSDVSVCLSLPLRKKTSVKNSPRSTPTISNISEEEDDESKTKADESDTLSHWDDDSSSTSIQTVKLSSGSGRSTASDIGSKSENEDATVRNKNLKGKQLPSKIVRKQEFVTIKETPVDTEQPPKEISKNDSSSESESESESEEESLESPKEKNGSINEVKTEITSSKTKEEDNIALTNGKTNNEEDDSSEESEESEEEDENETDAETAIQQKLEKINEAEENKNNGESISRNNKEIDGENENDTRRSNSKLQEESEEDDSGVTSDMSRQISDADTDGDSNLNELQLQCQRVATHSRLFKLLQDECSKSDDEDEDDNVKEDQEKNEKEVKSVGPGESEL
ncbi:Uncharacterized protein GBIM_03673, partial [Gryllus bimaculatus]